MSSSTAPNSGEGHSEFQDNLERYRQVPIFSGLSLEPLKLIAYLSTRETLKAGDVLFHRGDLPTALALVLAGTLHAYPTGDVPAPGFRDPEAVFGPGDSVGSLALLGKESHNYTVVAQDDVTYLTLTREKLKRTMEQFPEMGAKLCEALATRVMQWDRAAADAATRNKHRLGASLL